MSKPVDSPKIFRLYKRYRRPKRPRPPCADSSRFQRHSIKVQTCTAGATLVVVFLEDSMTRRRLAAVPTNINEFRCVKVTGTPDN